MWVHIISVDTERSAGTIGIKKFKEPLSNSALLWFDKKIAGYVMGHLTEKKTDIRHMLILEDSVGSRFNIIAFKDLR